MSVSADQEAHRSGSMEWGNLKRSSLRGPKWFHGDPGETRCGATRLVAKCPLRLVAVEMLVRRAAEHYRSSSVPRSLSVERSSSRAWCFRTPLARVHGSSAGSARHDGARLARPGGWGTILPSSLPGRRLFRSPSPEPPPRLVWLINTRDIAPMLITRAATRESSQLLDSPCVHYPKRRGTTLVPASAATLHPDGWCSAPSGSL